MDGRWRDVVLLAEVRRRRRVARLLRRMDRLDRRSATRSVDRGHWRAASAVAAVVLLLGGLFVASLVGGGRTSSSSGAFADRPEDASDSPIGAPAVVTSRSHDYAFMATQEGGDEPVAYDPCVPIHLVVDPRTIVDGGMRMLEQALDEVRDATGLTFVVDGLTSKDAPPAAAVTDADQRWLPVRVSWSDPARSSKLKGDVAGIGGSTPVTRDGHTWFVTGSVVLDGPQLADILEGRHGWASARSVVMHELGHLVGLAHVDAADELMHPKGSESVTTWGDGDRVGLSALGRGRCIPY